MSRNYHKMYNNSFEEPEIVEDVVETVEEAPVEEVEEVTEPEPVKEEPVKVEAKKARIGRLYNTEKLNVRKAPGGEVVMIIDKKQTVTIENDADPEWFEISSPIKGFVMKKFISE